MNNEKRNFDKEAALWDDNPVRIKLANDIADAVSQQIIMKPEMDIMDFGCGTGLLALHLHPHVRSITGVDSSQKMIDMFKMKIAIQKLNNVNIRHIDLDQGDTLEGNYDLVMSNMTLHHIKDIQPLFDQFYKITASGGYLCVSDLDLDDGQFHEDNTGVFHFGFDRANLHAVFTEAGFVDVRDITAAEVMKPSVNGNPRRFTVFLMIGRKRSNSAA